jgi:hypothetical protein
MKLFKKVPQIIVLAITLAFFCTTSAAQSISIPSRVQNSITPNNYLPKEYKLPDSTAKKLRSNNIDPAATAINFSVVSCKTAFAGRVKIEGVIKNNGANGFLAAANQAVVILYETIPGGTTKAVASRVFTSLATQGEIKISFTREWNKADEFPPGYKVVIAYDPDIYTDSRNSNDDANTNNNVFQREGSEINKIKFVCK